MVTELQASSERKAGQQKYFRPEMNHGDVEEYQGDGSSDGPSDRGTNSILTAEKVFTQS